MSRSWAQCSLLGRGTASWLKVTSKPMSWPLTQHAAPAQILISHSLKWSWQSSIYKVIWAHRIQSLVFLWSGVWILSHVSFSFPCFSLLAAILFLPFYSALFSLWIHAIRYTKSAVFQQLLASLMPNSHHIRVIRIRSFRHIHNVTLSSRLQFRPRTPTLN